MTDRVEMFTSTSKPESGSRSLGHGDTVTVRVCDDEGHSISRTLAAGEWSRLISGPKQA
jgi:hypothetical protein